MPYQRESFKRPSADKYDARTNMSVNQLTNLGGITEYTARFVVFTKILQRPFLLFGSS